MFMSSAVWGKSMHIDNKNFVKKFLRLNMSNLMECQEACSQFSECNVD